MGRLLSYLVDLIFVVVLSKVMGRAIGGFFGPSAPRKAASPRQGEAWTPSGERVGKTARDPVCNMFVSTDLSHRLVRGSETLHFCSRECLERYQKESANAQIRT
jgi:YHS domain-containing protein